VCSDLTHGLLIRFPTRDQLPEPLDHHEGGVAFVGVPHGGVDSHSAEYPHAADAENPFLSQAQLRPPGVELVHQSPVIRVIRLEVGIE
jgi:hypothetical protein